MWTNNYFRVKKKCVNYFFGSDIPLKSYHKCYDADELHSKLNQFSYVNGSHVDGDRQ